MQEVINGYIDKKVWGPDDEYLTVSVQVDSSKFKRGDLVQVTIEK